MRKILLFTASLLCAASMWAATPEKEGPWAMTDMKSMKCARNDDMSKSFNELDYSHFGTLEFWNDGDGFGYNVLGSSEDNSTSGLFYIAYLDEPVPAYTRKKLTWTYKMRSRTDKHYSNTCLYACDNLETLKSMQVDFTEGYNNQAGSEYLLSRIYNDDYDRKASDNYTKTFEIDNRSGDEEVVRSWYLMLTHVMSTKGSKSDLHEWGSFEHITAGWSIQYYKQFTFNANGGTGTMAPQEIENSGNLSANAFTRAGYTFAGWATTPKGERVYTNGQAITATENDKGAFTLYAVWTPSVATVISLINAIGAVQYSAESKAKIDAAREAYDALSEEDRALVANYTTLTDAESTYNSMNAIMDVKTKIDAIGVVTTESGDAITAALTAYLALSAEQKALMTATDLTTLLNAEDAYGVLTGKSTVQFKDNNDALIRSQVIALDYPEAPEIEGYTFQYWKTNAEDIENGIIRLQAVYTSDAPTDLEDVNAKANASKFIKDGNLYILKDEFIYTINGNRVNF